MRYIEPTAKELLKKAEEIKAQQNGKEAVEFYIPMAMALYRRQYDTRVLMEGKEELEA